MLKLDPEKHNLALLDETDLSKENILERYGLQKAIVNSWELFRNEIGIPSAIIIGSEIRPHNSTQDALDILAFDTDDSSLVVIELKRKKHKLQLLQALSYSAMVGHWSVEELLKFAKKSTSDESQELIDSIETLDNNPTVKLILIAEAYDPEVILTADWLRTNYSVDISAFSIELNKSDNNLILSVIQRYPLKGLADNYKSRSRRSASNEPENEVTWESVLPKLKYPFASKLIERCRLIKYGEPKRRRFGPIRSNFDGFVWISVYLKYNNVSLYIKGDMDEGKSLLQSKFSETVEINSWRDGWSVIIDTEEKYNDMVKWLQL